MDDSIRKHFQTADPVLFELIEKIPPFEKPQKLKSNEYFAHLCREIIGQQLSTKVAHTIFERFLSLFPQKKITPEYITKLSDQTIRNVGLSFGKVTFIKDLAQKIVDKTIILEKLPHLGDEEVIMELVKVKGIGRWTAEMFLMFSLNRPDVFSHGDYGLKKAIMKIYKLKKPPIQRQVERIIKKWSPYKTYACRILWRSLDLKD